MYMNISTDFHVHKNIYILGSIFLKNYCALWKVISSDQINISEKENSQNVTDAWVGI